MPPSTRRVPKRVVRLTGREADEFVDLPMCRELDGVIQPSDFTLLCTPLAGEVEESACLDAASGAEFAILLPLCHPIAQEKDPAHDGRTLVVLSCGGLLIRTRLERQHAHSPHRVLVSFKIGDM